MAKIKRGSKKRDAYARILKYWTRIGMSRQSLEKTGRVLISRDWQSLFNEDGVRP